MLCQNLEPRPPARRQWPSSRSLRLSDRCVHGWLRVKCYYQGSHGSPRTFEFKNYIQQYLKTLYHHPFSESTHENPRMGMFSFKKICGHCHHSNTNKLIIGGLLQLCTKINALQKWRVFWLIHYFPQGGGFSNILSGSVSSTIWWTNN